MATYEKYLNLSPVGQLLVETCLFLFERITTKDLEILFTKTHNQDILRLGNNTTIQELNECAKERFLVHRYSSVEALDFPVEEIYFHALKKSYFKELCLGFFKYNLEKKNYYTWIWKESYQITCLRMKLYVFDESEIQNSDILSSFLSRVNIDDRWTNSEKMQQQIFLKGFELNKIERIPFVKIRMSILEDAFSYLYFQMRVPTSYPAYLLDNLPEIKNHVSLQRLAHTLMYHNNKKGLQKLLKKAANTFSMTLARGHLHFLNGEFPEALLELEQSQILLKKLENQKKLPFSTTHVLIALCLLHKKADKGEWDNYWKNLFKDSGTNNYLSVTINILSGFSSIELSNEWSRVSDTEVIKNSPLQALVYLAYTTYWNGRTKLSRLFFSNNIVNDLRKNNPWIDLEFTALALMLGGQSELVPENAVLYKIFAPKPEWETFLDLLDKLITDKQESTPLEKEERLIWSFNPETFNIEAIVQKFNSKSQTWSKGRTVQWQKLGEQDMLKVMNEQDKEIYNTYNKIASNSNQYARNYDHFGDFLSALSGHPMIFLDNSKETQIQITKSKLELQLLKGSKGYQFENPYKEYTFENKFIFKRENATRYSFIKLTKEQQQLIQIINNKQITLPQKSEEQLKETLKKIGSIIPIHSDLDIENSNIPEHENDSRIFVHFLPVGENYHVELFVKPFGIVPPYFAPGAGHELILADVNGQTMYVQRDINAEKQAYESIIALSVVLNFDKQEEGIWTIDGIETCLQLLNELNNLRKEDKVVIEWPQGEKLKINSYANFENLSLSFRSSGDWFELDGELRVDDNTILTMQELLERSKDSKGRFLALNDGSFIALTEKLFKKLKELELLTQKQKDKLLISQFGAATFGDLNGELNISGDEGWNEFLKKMDEANQMEFNIPETLKAELRPYQKEGFQWLSRMAWWGAGACLADDMGLGKTVQTIALILTRAEEGPTLVVAPASVCSNWISELEKFAPTLQAINLSQVSDRNKTIENLRAGEILITTYGLLHQAIETLGNVNFTTIVLDEAQSIKNRFTKRSQAAMDLKGDFKLITTGTPMENHLGELWNLFNFINPGLLGSAQQFQERFALAIEKYGIKDRQEQLQKTIKPFILRRLKKDVLKDLPEKTEITLLVERSTAEEAFYEAIRRKALDNIHGQSFTNEGSKQIQVLAELMRLRRVCCHPSLINGGEHIPSSKLEALSDLLDELIENKHKALIFSQFVDYLRIIEKMVIEKGIQYKYLDGSTPLKKRKESIDQFQDGEGDLFLISLKAGGTGLNLTAADYVIHVDPWWNPAVEDQASDRAHRIGQLNPVTVYRLVSSGSIEEKIVKLHSHKRELAESLLMDTDGKIKLNSSDLIELLKN